MIGVLFAGNTRLLLLPSTYNVQYVTGLVMYTDYYRIVVVGVVQQQEEEEGTCHSPTSAAS